MPSHKPSRPLTASSTAKSKAHAPIPTRCSVFHPLSQLSSLEANWKIDYRLSIALCFGQHVYIAVELFAQPFSAQQLPRAVPKFSFSKFNLFSFRSQRKFIEHEKFIISLGALFPLPARLSPRSSPRYVLMMEAKKASALSFHISLLAIIRQKPPPSTTASPRSVRSLTSRRRERNEIAICCYTCLLIN
jgi:hypothetical protein